jgi:hypothetical protein
MDENRLKKVIQSALDISYGNITIKEFRALPTNKLDEETGKWVPDSYTLFIDLSRNSIDEEKCGVSNNGSVGSFLESLLGFECCVDFD